MTTVVASEALLAQLRAVGPGVFPAVDEDGVLVGYIRVFDVPDEPCVVDRSDTEE